jgi:outer membrane protein assembly factor BamB
MTIKSKQKRIKNGIYLVSILLIVGGLVYAFTLFKNYQDEKGIDNEIPAATPVQVSANEVSAMPRDTSALGGYDVLIADRGNNRIIEVTPDKKIVWEYDFNNLAKGGLGADDAFFTDNGKTLSVNLEELHVVELIDFATKKVTWSYGTLGKAGSGPGLLNTPDDAYKMPNGDITVADIKNCRIIEISPDKKIVRQYGVTGVCGTKDGLLNSPNGDTPVADGHTLISNIRSKNMIELDQNWQKVFSMPLPVNYPSDPQLTKAGNILISDYSNPGKIVEVSKAGNIVWQFTGDGTTTLNKPSLAIELPNGNILSNDDMNHRVIVIDKNTKKIIWQYGVTGKPGRQDGQLNIPDGVDIIMRTPAELAQLEAQAPTTPPDRIGTVSRHASNYINQTVRLSGYVIAIKNGYAIFSDEAQGTVGYYDLPVSGTGIDTVQLRQKYILDGTLIKGGLTAVNNNPYHLALSTPPQLTN